MQEVITKHIEQELVDEALDGYPYQFICAINEKDEVKITVRWPEDTLPAKTIRTISSMLYRLSAGDWTHPIINSVQKQGVKNKQIDVSSAIIQEWSLETQAAMDNNNSDTMCVSPRQVFAQSAGGQS